ncbi:MAG: hypothetical protein Q8N39_07640 [Pelolinea sp.]|nr:hypothetical protein [Pelolinea sp.]
MAQNKSIKNIVFRNINTYLVLFEIAQSEYKDSIKNEYGHFQNCLVSMLFCSLTLEGFLNHLGSKLDKKWEQRERGLSNTEKLNEVCSLISFERNKTNEPFCYFSTIFDFRDEIVHAKTKEFRIENAKMDKNNINPILPKPRWEKSITLTNCKKFIENTEQMITILFEKSELPGSAFSSPYIANWIIDRSI